MSTRNQIEENESSTSSSSSSFDDSQQQEDTPLSSQSRRKKRSFIPEEKKDPVYWCQRSKNNLSAKRSRVKRRMNDLVLETKLTQLSNENEVLKAKIDMLTRKFGQLTNEEQVEVEPLNTTDESLPSEKASPIPIKWRLKFLSSPSSNS